MSCLFTLVQFPLANSSCVNSTVSRLTANLEGLVAEYSASIIAATVIPGNDLGSPLWRGGLGPVLAVLLTLRAVPAPIVMVDPYASRCLMYWG